MPTIAIVNQTTVIDDRELAPVINANSIYINRDLNKFWGLTAWLIQVFKGQPVPAGAWQLILRDVSDDPSDEGYHTETADGFPIGYSFPKTNMIDKVDWRITLSHELSEMRVDPWTTYSAQGMINGKPVFRSLECADPCEDDQYAYKINGIPVSDFVTPKYFEDDSQSGPFDFAGHITGPGQLLINGYQSYFDVAKNGWIDVMADHAPDYKPPFPGSRRWLRQQRHEVNTQKEIGNEEVSTTSIT
jgi:hypothetical protein